MMKAVYSQAYFLGFSVIDSFPYRISGGIFTILREKYIVMHIRNGCGS